jgi:bifunctional N-acetylglucosamine-1-phosphate-uridyltransferase/glucosamine-1-phosphate-acetyltransferase GlmU-like protein
MTNKKLCQIVILAAGSGTRMQSSDLPKVMHTVGGRPMLDIVFDNASEVTEDIILVHSKQLLPYISHYPKSCKLALQERALGTAHAVLSAMNRIRDELPIAVIYGDNPLISSKIISDLLNHLDNTQSAIATLAFIRDDPAQYGRIVLDNSGNFIKIVEYKDASPEEKTVNLCNSGVMVFAPFILKRYLPLCVDQNILGNAEFYLTKIIEICAFKEKITYLLAHNNRLVVGVNTQEELRYANQVFQDMS